MPPETIPADPGEGGRVFTRDQLTHERLDELAENYDGYRHARLLRETVESGLTPDVQSSLAAEGVDVLGFELFVEGGASDSPFGLTGVSGLMTIWILSAENPIVASVVYPFARQGPDGPEPFHIEVGEATNGSFFVGRLDGLDPGVDPATWCEQIAVYTSLDPSLRDESLQGEFATYGNQEGSGSTLLFALEGTWRVHVSRFVVRGADSPSVEYRDTYYHYFASLLDVLGIGPRNDDGNTPPSRERLDSLWEPPAWTSGEVQLKGVPGFARYTQEGDSCGVASLLSALIIWEKERAKQGEPVDLVENALNNALAQLARDRKTTIDRLKRNGHTGRDTYRVVVELLTTIRDRIRKPRFSITESEYRQLSIALYVLYWDKNSNFPGLSGHWIGEVQKLLGFKVEASEGIGSFAEIFRSPIVSELHPGQIAQIGWYARRGGHAFLLGRFADGRWFLADQGLPDPFEVTARSLPELETVVSNAFDSGRSQIVTGTIRQPGVWTGIKILGNPADIMDPGLIAQGTYLAEVDTSALRSGDRLTSGGFVSRHYDRTEAWGAARELVGHGALIVELPKGVFNVYETNTVRTHNLSLDPIDPTEALETDGGLLENREFLSTDLLLSDGQNRRSMTVYRP